MSRKWQLLIVFLCLFLLGCQQISEPSPTFTIIPGTTMTSIVVTDTTTPTKRPATATFTAIPAARATDTPTSEPCTTISFSYYTHQRTNEPYFELAINALNETELPILSVDVIDDAWEGAFCEDTNEGGPIYRYCYFIEIEVEMTEQTIYMQRDRAEIVESIVRHLEVLADKCRSDTTLTITFIAPETKIAWQTDFTSVRSFYDLGERGNDLYAHGTNHVLTQ